MINFGHPVAVLLITVSISFLVSCNNSNTNVSSEDTAPVLKLPSNITSEATSPSGNTLEFVATAIDAEDGAISVDCLPKSGSLFKLGTTVVNCSATDSTNNTTNGNFVINIVDTTSPALTLPDDIIVDSTGPKGNNVNFSTFATDLVDGDTTVNCNHQSGELFPLGTSTLIECATMDSHGNSTAGSFSVIIKRPNFLIIITDDQSNAHSGKAGYKYINTPNIDELANSGVYFINAHAPAPTCTASRSAILSGQHIWRLKSSANLWGEWSDVMISFQDILKDNGYSTGSTAKGWGPGVHSRNSPPVGKAYNIERRAVPDPAYNSLDYVANFRNFLDTIDQASPFSFWMGITEPHRPYAANNGERFQGIEGKLYLPDYLVKTKNADIDLQGYLTEIEHIDNDLGNVINLLKERGIFDNTIIIFTSDNGMPFPRAKVSGYLYGSNVPFIINWPIGMDGPRDEEKVISLTDIAPTLLEVAGISIPDQMTGISLIPLIQNRFKEWSREFVYSAFERHNDNVRAGGVGYSTRVLHNKDWLYIRNNFPDRWPAGDPPSYGEGYIRDFRDDNTGNFIEPYFSLTTGKRPRDELYYLPADPYQLDNLAANPNFSALLAEFSSIMDDELLKTEDPVFITGEDIFSLYPSFQH